MSLQSPLDSIQPSTLCVKNINIHHGKIKPALKKKKSHSKVSIHSVNCHCSIRGAAGPLPDVVPFFNLPGCVPTERSRFPCNASVGSVCCLCPRVLLRLQGQLAPWAGVSGEQPAYYLLPSRRKQVLLLTVSVFYIIHQSRTLSYVNVIFLCWLF